MTQEVSVHTHTVGRAVAFSWQQKSPGDWVRHLVRQCRKCDFLIPNELVWVNLDFDLCANCLGQELVPDPLDDDLIVCRACGMRSEMGSGLPADEPLELDDDDSPS